VGGSYGAFRTTLRFGDELVALQQMAVSASLEWRATKTLSLQFAAGGIFNGRLAGDPMGPGGVGSVAVSWLVLDQAKWWPFVQLSASASFSAVQALVPQGDANPRPALYSALDVRGGVVAGYTLFERVTPYVVGRLFGGPVFYGTGPLGTDLYHYQVGLGVVVGLPKGFDLSAELIPLGEQRVTAAVGYSF
jgi:hypothetical protein